MRRDFLFIGLCLVGFAGLAGNLLRGERVSEPEDFRPQRYVRPDFQDVVRATDSEFRLNWEDEGLKPAGRASDLTICRRLSLALTGTLPSLEEIRQIEAQPEDHRLQWWLSHLFEDRRYCDYVGERFARVFVGTENGPFLVYRRRRFVSWLADQLEKNTRYDVLVRDLIAERGLWTDSPAVNFVTVTLDQNNDQQPDVAKLTRRVSRAFLGVRLDCVQCHDDNLGGDWLQTDFHQMAAFFAGARQSAIGVNDETHDYEFQYLDAAESQIVQPKVPFYTELLAENATPRAQLARWVTHKENKAFARTAVNRAWALLFGVSMFEAVDNVPLEGPFPPGLEVLAEDFVQHGYDLQRLIRLIAATEPFQRNSRAQHELTVDHENHWASFPLTRLRPEQIAGSLLQSASLSTIDAQSHILRRIARGNQENEFIRRYGDTGEDEFGAHGGTIPQRLLMMNGSLVKNKTKDDLFGNAATRIAALAPDDAKAIETAFLAVLTRRPNSKELAHFVARLDDTRNKARNRRMEDIYWALLNSTEFSWNH